MIKRLIRCAISLIIVLCLSASLVQAQTESSGNKQGSKSVTNEGGLSFFNLLARSRRPAIILITSGRDASTGVPAFTFTPTAVGANHPVFGTGTVGLSVNGSGVFGQSGSGLAGQFDGDVDISGTLSAAVKNFKIDHPLDPENTYLYHVSVESPDMKNIYDGNVTTNENGEAVVELPAYFEALNRDFRYQLTVIGTFAQAIVADEIKANRFTIRTNAPGVKVSWQVTGIRQDGWAKKNRIQVEVEKPERERGFYLHPEAFNLPEERGIEWARNPEMMRHIKQQRIEKKQRTSNQ